MCAKPTPPPDPTEPAAALAAALRSPLVPSLARTLEDTGYLALAWPQLAPSVDTAGFLGSALYMADMALDAVEEAYEPLLSPAALLAEGALDDAELQRLRTVLDVFHWLQPQLLLLVAAMSEAWEAESVGGQGRPSPRDTSERELAHLATDLPLEAPTAPLLTTIAETLQIAEAPELYRAVAIWPRYLETAWEELQHLVAYPLFRQRGRALYYYARSSSRFLAQPLRAGVEELRAHGLTEAQLTATRATLDAALPTLATMMMHGVAMRVGLGDTTREVVDQP